MSNQYIEQLQAYFTSVHMDKRAIILDGLHFMYPNVDYMAYVLAGEVSHADYRFDMDMDMVMIDVGLHIGTTSLLKSVDPKVKKIYAYEPLRYTFDIAKKI
ncbi:MAG: hypothetical protein ACRCV3_03360 [Desulfovibrionaceae bacterium]